MLIEAGATCIRPILMTSGDNPSYRSLMALAIGSSGSTTGSGDRIYRRSDCRCIVALLRVPVYYALLSWKPKEEILDID